MLPGGVKRVVAPVPRRPLKSFTVASGLSAQTGLGSKDRSWCVLVQLLGTKRWRQTLSAGTDLSICALTLILKDDSLNGAVQLRQGGMTESIGRRDFLVSIRPVHAVKIVEGLKTVELRRRFSEDVAPGTIILIYSTSPIKAIVGSANIRGVHRLQLGDLWDQYGAAACIDRETFDEYFSGLHEGYAIQLQNVRAFARQVAAADLKEKFGFIAPQSFMYLRQEYYPLLNHERVQATN
jgi:predicted transcriptional regulator